MYRTKTNSRENIINVNLAQSRRVAKGSESRYLQHSFTDLHKTYRMPSNNYIGEIKKRTDIEKGMITFTTRSTHHLLLFHFVCWSFIARSVFGIIIVH